MHKLILLDYSMPNLDGPQVAKAILAHFEDNGLLDLRPYLHLLRVGLHRGQLQATSTSVRNGQVFKQAVGVGRVESAFGALVRTHNSEMLIAS